MASVAVKDGSIELPDWMSPEYDYVVKWNKYTNEWEVVPF